jgi:hypothetical protein
MAGERNKKISSFYFCFSVVPNIIMSLVLAPIFVHNSYAIKSLRAVGRKFSVWRGIEVAKCK